MSTDSRPGPEDLRLVNRMAGEPAWACYLAGHDPVWERMPRAWHEAPFLGNGRLGAMVYQPDGTDGLRFDVQHAEVQDHRPPRHGAMLDRARLLVGHFTLRPRGEVTGIEMRLNLWDASLSGRLATDRGGIAFTATVLAEQPLLLVSLSPSEGEADASWEFTPAEATSPRNLVRGTPADYEPNPAPVLRRDTDTTTTADTDACDVDLAVQDLLHGGRTATAWTERPGGPGERTLVACVAHSPPESSAAADAAAAVRAGARRPVSALLRAHRDWWHRFYPKSFVSLPDRRLEGFYWIQLYKLGSAAREDGPVMATTGPWLTVTAWPLIWWNLNVQLEYWLIHGSNHLELDAVTYSLSRFRRHLADAVPDGYGDGNAAVIHRMTDTALVGAQVPPPGDHDPEAGNLTWALHNVWLSYRHTLDGDLLREVLFPLLRRAVNFYLPALREDDRGRLHIPATTSPEYPYPEAGPQEDCTFDLALLRWACGVLLDADDRLGTKDPLRPAWQDVLDRLADYPVGADGYMVDSGTPFDRSHRHFSHLLMVYPLHLVTGREDAASRELVERTLAHWLGFPDALQGYTFTAAASICAVLRDGERAAGHLGTLLGEFATANTCYWEEYGGHLLPAIETPLAAVQSVYDMLVQSWDGTVDVFPAVPDAWADITVHDVLAQGAFLVSAARTAGTTRFVRLYSRAGAPCRLRTDLARPLRVGIDGRPAGAARWRETPDGVVEIDLAAGEEALVTAAGDDPDLTVAPVAPNPAPAGAAERWGLPGD